MLLALSVRCSRQEVEVAGDTGIRYAKVSGDWNPHHLYPWSARLLGYRSPIAHGLWTLARAVAVVTSKDWGVFCSVLCLCLLGTRPGFWHECNVGGLHNDSLKTVLRIIMNCGVVEMVPAHHCSHKKSVYGCVRQCWMLRHLLFLVSVPAGLLVLQSGVFLACTKRPGFWGVRNWFAKMAGWLYKVFSSCVLHSVLILHNVLCTCPYQACFPHKIWVAMVAPLSVVKP